MGIVSGIIYLGEQKRTLQKENAALKQTIAAQEDDQTKALRPLRDENAALKGTIIVLKIREAEACLRLDEIMNELNKPTPRDVLYITNDLPARHNLTNNWPSSFKMYYNQPN